MTRIILKICFFIFIVFNYIYIISLNPVLESLGWCFETITNSRLAI